MKDKPDRMRDSFLTKKRNEIISWLKANAPSLSDIYEGSLIIMYEKENFPGRIRFVSHAIREIINRLPDVIAGTRMARIDYKSRCDHLASLWEEFGFKTEGIIMENSVQSKQVLVDKVDVPIFLFNEIGKLIIDHKKSRENPKEKAIRLFEAIAPGNNQFQIELYPIVKQWIDLSKIFVGMTHETNSKENNDIESNVFKDNFEIFEQTLWALISSFSKTIEELDEILEDTNS